MSVFLVRWLGARANKGRLQELPWIRYKSIKHSFDNRYSLNIDIQKISMFDVRKIRKLSLAGNVTEKVALAKTLPGEGDRHYLCPLSNFLWVCAGHAKLRRSVWNADDEWNVRWSVVRNFSFALQVFKWKLKILYHKSSHISLIIAPSTKCLIQFRVTWFRPVPKLTEIQHYAFVILLQLVVLYHTAHIWMTICLNVWLNRLIGKITNRWRKQKVWRSL